MRAIDLERAIRASRGDITMGINAGKPIIVSVTKSSLLEQLKANFDRNEETGIWLSPEGCLNKETDKF